MNMINELQANFEKALRDHRNEMTREDYDDVVKIIKHLKEINNILSKNTNLKEEDETKPVMYRVGRFDYKGRR